MAQPPACGFFYGQYARICRPVSHEDLFSYGQLGYARPWPPNDHSQLLQEGRAGTSLFGRNVCQRWHGVGWQFGSWGSPCRLWRSALEMTLRAACPKTSPPTGRQSSTSRFRHSVQGRAATVEPCATRSIDKGAPNSAKLWIGYEFMWKYDRHCGAGIHAPFN